MARDIIIAPSILASDFSRLGEEIATVDRAGADWIHLDVMSPLVRQSSRRYAAIPTRFLIAT